MSHPALPDLITEDAFDRAYRSYARSVDSGEQPVIAVRAALGAVATDLAKMTDLLTLATVLHTVAGDLDGFIQRRAEDLAGPIVAQAKDDAAARIREAESETRRQADLVNELRRRIPPLDRQAAKWVACRDAARKVLGAYQQLLDNDDLDGLRDALTVLQEAANA